MRALPPCKRPPPLRGQMPGMQVDPQKIVWTPYNAERDYANYRN